MANALLVESIPCLLATFLARTPSVFKKAFFAFLILASMFGFGVFVHDGGQGGFSLKDDQHQAQKERRELTLENINRLSQELTQIPQDHITRRQKILDKISAEKESLSQIQILKAPGQHSVQVGFGVWLRIMAMLVNAYLIHQLCRIFLGKISPKCHS